MRAARKLLHVYGMAIFTFRDLDAWRHGMDLVEQCYRATARFPQSEQYGLTAQIRRAAVSIPSNIAEGHCRRTTAAYANQVSIALGSHGELKTCVEIAYRLRYLTTESREPIVAAVESVGRLLNGLHNALERRLAQKHH